MAIIKRSTEYGIRALAHMATSHELGRPHCAHSVARATGVPAPYMGKTLSLLAKARILRVKRGAFGGYVLVKHPQEISLRHVIEVLQGPVAMNRCVLPAASPRSDPHCPFRPTWSRVQSELIEMFDSVTLQDMLDGRIMNDDSDVPDEMLSELPSLGSPATLSPRRPFA